MPGFVPVARCGRSRGAPNKIIRLPYGYHGGCPIQTDGDPEARPGGSDAEALLTRG